MRILATRETRGQNIPALILAALGFVLAFLFHTRPLSMWLVRLTPDGQLQPETRAFLDALDLLVLAFAIAALVVGLSSGLRQTLRSAWSRDVVATIHGSRLHALIPAVLAGAIRLAMAAVGDVGLGDDGARVFWLQLWLKNHDVAWDSLWAPGHLFLHVLAWSVVRDPVRSGVLLSVVASAGLVWLLARSIARDWGDTAGWLAGLCAALLPVSVAHGATPDVNPVFAFLIVAAVSAVGRFRSSERARWLVVSWACLAFAAWARFESFLIVSGVALLLWPRWRWMCAFALASLVPTFAWNVILYLRSGDALRVVHTVRSSYGTPPWMTGAFTFSAGVWVAITLPFLLLGCLGAVRALRARRGRQWLPVMSLHVAVLGAAAVISGQGLQPRYLILAGSILAAYSGVALAGMLERSRRYGALFVGATALLLAWTPFMYPTKWDLWIRRSDSLRQVVDRVAQLGTGRDVVWIGESAFFLPCRASIPIERYHVLVGPVADPARIRAELEKANQAVACVQDSPFGLRMWAGFLDNAEGSWTARPLETLDGHHVYALTRVGGVDPPTSSTSPEDPSMR